MTNKWDFEEYLQSLRTFRKYRFNIFHLNHVSKLAISYYYRLQSWFSIGTTELREGSSIESGYCPRMATHLWLVVPLEDPAARKRSPQAILSFIQTRQLVRMSSQHPQAPRTTYNAPPTFKSLHLFSARLTPVSYWEALLTWITGREWSKAR